jgi:hypothetical protein
MGGTEAVIAEVGFIVVYGGMSLGIWSLLPPAFSKLILRFYPKRYDVVLEPRYVSFRDLLTRAGSIVFLVFGILLFAYRLEGVIPSGRGLPGFGFYAMRLPSEAIIVIVLVSWILPALWLIEDCRLRCVEEGKILVLDPAKRIVEFINIFASFLVVFDILSLGQALLDPAFSPLLFLPLAVVCPIAFYLTSIYFFYPYRQQKKTIDDLVKKEGVKLVQRIMIDGLYVLDRKNLEKFLDSSTALEIQRHIIAPLLRELGYVSPEENIQPSDSFESIWIRDGLRMLVVHRTLFGQYLVCSVLLPRVEDELQLDKSLRNELSQIERVFTVGIKAPDSAHMNYSTLNRHLSNDRLMIDRVLMINPHRNNLMDRFREMLRMTKLASKVEYVGRETLIDLCQRHYGPWLELPYA